MSTQPPTAAQAGICAAVRAAVAAYAKTGRMLHAALAYAAHGYPVFPLTTRKTPVPPRDKDANGKDIPGTGSFYKATTDPLILHDWWDHKQFLIGMPMGERTGVWCLDIDTDEDHASDGVAAFKKLVEEHGAITTREHLTASGGMHLILNWDAEKPIRCSAGDLPNGIEVKGTGGYIVVPPSQRKKRSYTVHDDIDPIEAPSWLTDLILQGRTYKGDISYGGPITAEMAVVAEAMSFIPNPELDWNTWNDWGLAIWASTAGQGFEIFDAFSQKSPNYHAERTMTRWEGITGSPPNRTGFGKIRKRAEQHGWVHRAAPTYAAPVADVGAARAETEKLVHRFLKWEVRHPEAESNNLIKWAQSVDPDFPPEAQALRVTTGVGKTQITINEIAQWLCTVNVGPVIYAVPTLKLADRIAAQFVEHDNIEVKVFRGRDAVDPEGPDEKTQMCLNKPAVELAMDAHTDINTACCKSKTRKCRFFDRCGYQRQRQHTPQVWVIAADLLFHRQDAFGAPSMVVIDESYWEKGLFGMEKDVLVPPSYFGAPGTHNPVADLLLRQEHDGGIERRHVAALGVYGLDLGQMIIDRWHGLDLLWKKLNLQQRTLVCDGSVANDPTRTWGNWHIRRLSACQQPSKSTDFCMELCSMLR